MASPFPGMDPWLEAHWGDVHTSLVTYARNQLRPQLPSGLKARVEEYVSVEGDDEFLRSIAPDVRVIERSPDSTPAAGEVALAEPLVVPIDAEPQTLRRVLIVDRESGDRIVTAIEILSPANKRSEAGQEQYKRKQRELLEAKVNLVEIDLVRSGNYVLAAPQHCVPLAFFKPYRICVLRSIRPRFVELYRATYFEPLQRIRVPLREADADVGLDLQQMIDQAYADGDYATDIDYGSDPTPPLRGNDAHRVDEFLREKGLR